MNRNGAKRYTGFGDQEYDPIADKGPVQRSV